MSLGVQVRKKRPTKRSKSKHKDKRKQGTSFYSVHDPSTSSKFLRDLRQKLRVSDESTLIIIPPSGKSHLLKILQLYGLFCNIGGELREAAR